MKENQTGKSSGEHAALVIFYTSAVGELILGGMLMSSGFKQKDESLILFGLSIASAGLATFVVGVGVNVMIYLNSESGNSDKTNK